MANLNILTDKTNRCQAVVTAVVLLALILVGQMAVRHMAEDYKQAMLEHDYAAAGYLAQSGVDGSRIARAFTADKAAEEIEAGRLLLDTAGYNLHTDISLLLAVEGFYRRSAVTALILSVVFSLILLTVLYDFIRRRDQKLEAAEMIIRRFLDGETAVRLPDSGEGSLSRLCAAVNTMATSLYSHIEKEKQGKEFLKDTVSDISHQ
jgi:methyl-accepting chemotaxis protein